MAKKVKSKRPKSRQAPTDPGKADRQPKDPNQLAKWLLDKATADEPEQHGRDDGGHGRPAR
ncbi:MAG: hypothetical protein H6811_10615 [Phycisphaeraceae bacterium]|nr:hypothetical protein [Phycisphaeraceae bacterium]